MDRINAPTAMGIATAAVIAQVILPAAIDLIASVAIFGCGAVCGWRGRQA